MISLFVRELCSSIVDIIYPPLCPGCSEVLEDPDSLICSECHHALHLYPPPYCERCGTPWIGIDPGRLKKGCQKCPPEPIGFDVARSVANYGDERVKNLVHALKYSYLTSLAEPLARILCVGFDYYFKDERLDAIVPVPLHPRKLREREFNQAGLLSQEIAKSRNLPVREDLIRRIRPTPPQAKMSPKLRAQNVAGAFQCPAEANVKGLRLLVIDDVYTTGCTVSEVSRTLMKNGAKFAAVLTLARALDH